MTPNPIEAQLRSGESSRVEFASTAENLEHIGRTVCAMLNSEGGSVFIGVDDRGKLVGVLNAEREAQALREYLRKAITPSVLLLSVTVDEEDGKALIAIEVAAGQDRPYVYEGAVYLRHGSRNRTADAAALRRLVQTEALRTERWERRPSMALEDEDLDRNEIRRMGDEVEKAGRLRFREPGNIQAQLKELGVFRSGQYTNAADVLFTENPALRHPQVRVRTVCFTEDKDSSQYVDDRMLEGPLVSVLKEAEAFLQRNMRISVSFGRKALRTDDRPAYPQEAIREGLVNAFAHRDYADFSGGLAVRLYPSRLEIWNSGHFPEGITPGDLTRSHPSIPVNPDIAHVLYIRAYMNRIGRGTQNLANACRAHGLRPPKWEDTSSGVTLTLYAPSPISPGAEAFNDRQLALLAALTKGEEIRPGDYRDRFAEGVSERQARRDLKELEEANLLEQVGSGRATRYRRTTRAQEG